MGILSRVKIKIVQVKDEIVQVIKPHPPVTKDYITEHKYREKNQKLVFGSTEDRYYKVFMIVGENGEKRFASTTVNKVDLTDKETEKVGRSLNSRQNYKNNSDPVPFKSATCTYCYDRATGKTLWKSGGSDDSDRAY